MNFNSDEGKSPIKAVHTNILNVPLCHQPFFIRCLSACGGTRIDELVSTDGLSLGKQNVFVCSFLFVLVGKVEGSIMNHSPPMLLHILWHVCHSKLYYCIFNSHSLLEKKMALEDAA